MCTNLHPFHRQERRQIGGERGQHEDDEHPVRGDQDPTADGFRRFSSSLWRERRQREPKALDESEIPVRQWSFVLEEGEKNEIILSGSFFRILKFKYFSCNL